MSNKEHEQAKKAIRNLGKLVDEIDKKENIDINTLLYLFNKYDIPFDEKILY